MQIATIFPEGIAPYLSLMVIGFVIGIVGHIYKNKKLVALGIALIFLATFLLPLAIVATTDEPPNVGPDVYSPGE